MNLILKSNKGQSKISSGYAQYLLFSLLIIALLAPVIANQFPLYVSWKGNTFSPAINNKNYSDLLIDGETVRLNYNNCDFDTLSNATVVYPLIPYGPEHSDLTNSGYVSPFESQFTIIDNRQVALTGTKRHLLGTGKRGEDILAGLIYGTRVSLAVGFFSMLIAGLIGILLGAFAGYLGDATFKTTRGTRIALLLGIVPSWFYGFQTTRELLPEMNWVLNGIICFTVFTGLMIFFGWIGKVVSKRNKVLKTTVAFPVDTLIMKVVELIASLPVLLLILIVASIARPAISSLIWIIGLTSWTEIARLTRAEVLKIRQLDYIQSARSTGMAHWQIIVHHALPNALNPTIVYLTFGAAGAILVESALSFLGVGVPPGTATWGGIIASGKQEFSAWWMILFPGLMLFITVSSIYAIGMRLQKKRNLN